MIRYTLMLLIGIHYLNPSDCAIVDLSWEYDSDRISRFPNQRLFQLRVVKAGGVPWIAYNEFATSEHMGTHIDAPFHFNKMGATVDELTMSQLHGPAIVINITDRVQESPDSMIRIQDIWTWEDEHGTIPEGAYVLMLSGWSQYWGNQMQYVGTNSMAETQKFHWPGFTANAVKWLIEARNISGIGVDSISCDPGIVSQEESPNHEAITKAGKICVENIADTLAEVPPTGAELYIFPMKIKDGTGAPARVYAMWGEDHIPHPMSSSAVTAHAKSIFSIVLFSLCMFSLNLTLGL